jgi:hypothetical protein
MKTRLNGLFTALLAMSFAATAAAQGTAPKVPAEEAKMAQAITSAPDAAAKVKAGADFVKKYPKSTLRSQVAGNLVDEIERVTDPAGKVGMAQTFQTTFTEPSEQEMIMPTLVESLAQAKRIDEAFTIGTEFLGKNPDSILVLVRLLSAGTEAAKAQNAKYIPQSLQYGGHAIELIEAGKLPAGVDLLAWQGYKASLVPTLYQSMGMLHFLKGDRADAKARLTKASQLVPNEPFNYLMLASIQDDEYQEAAKAYQARPGGAARDQALQKAHTAMDSTIDLYAHFVAVAEGNARFADSRTQTMQTLEAYYKYRHKGTEGLQALIDKYKPQPKP